MDDFDKKLKELLDNELDMSGIIVSGDLIKRTLVRAEEDVIAGRTKRNLIKGRYMKGIVSAAAVLLTIYIGYSIISNTGFKTAGKNDSAQIGNESTAYKTSLDSTGSTNSMAGGTDGGAAGDTMNNSGADDNLLESDAEYAAADEESIPAPGEAGIDTSSENKGMDSLIRDMTEESETEEPDGDLNGSADNADDAVLTEFNLSSGILSNVDIIPDQLGSFVESNIIPDFPNSWTTTAGGGEIVFTITCSSLGIIYYCTADGLSGQFEVYVDGGLAAVLDADNSSIGGDYAKEEWICAFDEAAEHTVMIKKAEGSTGEVFTILGVAVLY